MIHWPLTLFTVSKDATDDESSVTEPDESSGIEPDSPFERDHDDLLDEDYSDDANEGIQTDNNKETRVVDKRSAAKKKLANEVCCNLSWSSHYPPS
jgi:hypothetical protein